MIGWSTPEQGNSKLVGNDTGAGTWPSPYDSENYIAAFKERLDRDKVAAEIAKTQREISKLDREARIGNWAFLLEPLKNFLPAISIFGSVLLGYYTLKEQRTKDTNEHERDRGVEVSKRLAEYETTVLKSAVKGDKEFSPRLAVLTLRSLGKEAIPILIDHLQLSPGSDLSTIIKGAILELNEDPLNREETSRDLLSAFKTTIIRDISENRVDLSSLHQYVEVIKVVHSSNRISDAVFADAEAKATKTIIANVRVIINNLPKPKNETEAGERKTFVDDVNSELTPLEQAIM